MAELGRCLFALVLVNKTDLLTIGERDEHFLQIEGMLHPLRDKLRKALPHVAIDVIFGSARGAAAIDIRNKLAYHATVQES